MTWWRTLHSTNQHVNLWTNICIFASSYRGLSAVLQKLLKPVNSTPAPQTGAFNVHVRRRVNNKELKCHARPSKVKRRIQRIPVWQMKFHLYVVTLQPLHTLDCLILGKHCVQRLGYQSILPTCTLQWSEISEQGTSPFITWSTSPRLWIILLCTVNSDLLKNVNYKR